MSQKCQSSARGAIIRWVAFTQLSTLIVILIGSLVFSAVTKRRISGQVATDMHNSLLTGEYRNAMVIASLAAKTDFSRIYFTKKDGEVAFSVPVEESRGQSHFLTDVIRQPIKYAPDGGEVAGYLFFEGDPFELVPQGFILWALITVVSIPLYASAYRRIEKRHVQEIAAQKNEAIAQLSQNLAHDLKNPLIAFDFAARSQSWDEFLRIRDQLNRSYATVMSIIHAIGKGDTEITKPEDVVIDFNQSVSDIRQIFTEARTAIHFEGPASIRCVFRRSRHPILAQAGSAF
ncbi:MAG: hypothetical protein FJ146_17175 [Deltaproteobacteria bacterium]|nr:hypothetical protein [Deltaproteobacteria bacterium]